jgi:polysaccharide export outer membrane protein
VLLALVPLGGCMQTPARVGAAVATTEPLPPPDAAGAFATQAEYRIGPLDELDISVFQVPDLARTVHVDANGEVMLPLIGNVAAAGKTAQDLASDIASRLGAEYLQSPEVSVVVVESPTRRITVEGAVESPGMFPVAGRTSLLQAIALSGGLTEVASAGSVTVFRTIQNERMAASFDLAAIRSGKSADPEVYGGDVIVVGQSGARTALRDLGRAVPVMGIFTPLL